MRRLLAIAVLAVAAASLGAAVALSAAPASPVVPKGAELELKALLLQIGAPALGVVPTRLPAHYAFESYTVTGTPPGIDVSFTDQRFLKTDAIARAHEISFDTSYHRGAPATCGAKSRKTLRVTGVPVYSGQGTVWRCVSAAHGRVVQLTASGHAPAAALALLVASARSMG